MWKLALGPVAIIIATFLFTALDPGTHATEAGGIFVNRDCNGTLAVGENQGDHPVLWPLTGSWKIELTSDGNPKTADSIDIIGPPPVIQVNGLIDGEGGIEASGEGTYSDHTTAAIFNGFLEGDPTDPIKLTGEYIVGKDQELPTGFPIYYDLDCQVPPDQKKYDIIAMKLDQNGAPVQDPPLRRPLRRRVRQHRRL
jgi:hypothetical protein